ncbi:MAG: hypothetical protein ACRDID_22905, partial [Ktedonobacterales bacterium]
ANIHAMSYSDRFPISIDAYNFWWLTNLHARSMGSSLLGVSIDLVAETLFGVTTVTLAVQIWRHFEPAYLCFGLAMETFGFFMFMGGQLERYLFPFIPLMLATVIVSERKGSDRLLTLYVTGTALCWLNMLISIGANLAGVSPIFPYMSFQPLSDFLATYFGFLGFAVAAYLMATFSYALWIYLAGRFTPLTVEATSVSRPGA